MSNLLAFPMYAVDRADTRALWLAVKGLLAARGVPVEDVPDGPESDLLTHWRQPGLVLSQACGYPLVTQLSDVQVVAVFTTRPRAAKGSTTAAFWWCARRIGTSRWRIFAADGRSVTLRTRSPATMRCEKKWRLWWLRSRFSRKRPSAAAIASR